MTTVDEAIANFMNAASLALGGHPEEARAIIRELHRWADPLTSARTFREKFEGFPLLRLQAEGVLPRAVGSIEASQYVVRGGSFGTWRNYVGSVLAARPWLQIANGEISPADSSVQQALRRLEGGMQTVSTRQSFEVFRTAIRGTRDQIISLLRSEAEELPEPGRRIKLAQIRIIEGFSEILIRLIFAVSGVIYGLVRGFIDLLVHLPEILRSLLEQLLIVYRLRRGDARAVNDVVNLGRVIFDETRQRLAAWLQEFRQADEDRQTFMLGALIGELLLIIRGAALGIRSRIRNRAPRAQTQTAGGPDAPPRNVQSGPSRAETAQVTPDDAVPDARRGPGSTGGAPSEIGGGQGSPRRINIPDRIPMEDVRGRPLARGLRRAYRQLAQRYGIDVADPYTLEKLNEIFHTVQGTNIKSRTTALLTHARGASGELRTLIRYSRQGMSGGPSVQRVRFARPVRGAHTPDIEVTRSGRGGVEWVEYAEVKTVTQARQGSLVTLERGTRDPQTRQRIRDRETLLIDEFNVEKQIYVGQISVRNPGTIVFHALFGRINRNWLPTWRDVFAQIRQRRSGFPDGVRRIEVTTGSGGLLVFEPPDWRGRLIRR